MKAILINVTDETVKEVEINDKNHLKSIYGHLDCQMIEVAVNYYDKKDTVYVDEEGLFTLSDESKFFSIEGGHQPFVGNGIVMGLDYNTGESVDVHMSVEEVKRMVKFHTLWEVRSMV